MGRLEDRKKSMKRGSYPKISVDKRIEVRKNDETDEPAFFTYDPEAKARVVYPSPIVGVLIGEVMDISVYSEAEEKYYQSSYFLSKKNTVALFKGQELDTKGTVEEISTYLVDIKKCNSAPKKRVFLVLTKEGLLAITSSIIISIDQTNKIRKENPDSFVFNHIVLTPDRYDPESKLFNSFTHKKLKITKANKNYPYFANISVGEKLTDEILKDLGEEEKMNEFTEWSEFIGKGGVSATEDQDVSGQTANDSNQSSSEPEQGGINYDDDADPGDDLPF